MAMMATSQSKFPKNAEVFARKPERKSVRSVSCSNCLQTFSVRDPLHPRGLRCPLVLQCGHSACENCIRTSLRTTEKVICGICKHISTQTHQNSDIRHDFPLNLYLLGIFAARHSIEEPEDSKINFVPVGSSSSRKSSSKEMQESDKTETCGECMKQNAEWRCQQCEVVYCEHCFDKVHKAARSLSKHKKCPLEISNQQKISLPQHNCEEHTVQSVEFYCIDCDKFICSHCLIGLHQGHSVITKKQKNEESVSEMENAMEKTAEVMKRLLHTQKKLGDVIVPAVGSNLTPVELEVTRHFLHLHGALQLLEQNVLDKLRSVKTENANKFASVMNELNSNIQQVRQVIQQAAAAKDPSNFEKVEVTEITKKLLAAQKLPCHLVSAESHSVNNSPVRFIADETILDQLLDHCQLEIDTTTTYSLVRTEDLSPDAVIEPIDDVEKGQTTSSEVDAVMPSSRASSVSALSEEATVSSMEQSVVNQKTSPSKNNFTRKKKHLRNFVRGNTDTVIVCHLRDPSSFYVHRVVDTANLQNLCQELARHADNFNTPPDSVLQNGLYMVQYQADGKWYRARVRSIISPTDDSKEDQVDILYIDYGNTEIIPATRLRCIPPKFAQIPAIALHCSLFGLNPVGGKWSQEAVKSLAMMVNGTKVKMIMMEYNADTYQVDLCQLPGENHDNDVPISVRDAIVFLEHGCLLDETKYQVNRIHKPMKYFQVEAVEKGDLINVVVSHIETPHSFYVQRLGEHADYLSSLMKDMNSEYLKAGNKGLIYTPQIGMPCAAQYTIDKNWYRAKIVDLPGNKMVKVFYVDFGNDEVMSWNRLRKLHPKFMRLAAQGIYCSLSDIVPNQLQWTSTAKDYLIKVTGKKVIHMYVDEVQKCPFKVTLYESQADVDLCINALLVRDGYATSVGVSSSLVEFQKFDGLLLHPQVSNLKIKHSKVNKKKTFPNGKIQDVTQSTQNGSLFIPEDSEEHEMVSSEDPFRLEVKVLNCPSPSCIYVALLSQEEQINSLMSELQEYYGASSSHNIDNWEVNNKCCAFSIAHKQWYRAIILELLPDEQAKVFLKDIAEVKTVPLKNLQLLDPKFLPIRDGAIKCHLAGVRAAGDKPEWPGLACEYLAEQIAKYPNIYITKKGDIEDWSLPVELWVKRVISGGPLEPTREEWKTLNKHLIDQGLAIPVRGESDIQSSPSLHLLQELDEQIEEACRNSVSSWLQLSSQVQVEDSTKTESGEIVPEIGGVGGISDTEEREEEESTTPSVTDWLPPQPVTKNMFAAIPTYVDDDCYIYLHDSEKCKNTLDMIGSALLVRFRNSQPKPHDLYWFPGQLCIAQYHSDQKWYRGKVLEVNDDRTVKVLFVDYGNVEDCKASEMRKNVYLSEFPIQCHKTRLEGVKPVSEDGQWPTSTLDFIHTTIVEKYCTVIVKQEPQVGQPLSISLITPSGMDLVEILVRMQFGLYADVCDLDATCNLDGALDEEASVIVEDEQEVEKMAEVELEDETEMKERDENEDSSSVKAKEIVVDIAQEPLVNLRSPIEWNDLIDEEEKLHQVEGNESGPNIIHYKPLELPETDEIAVEVTAIVSASELVIHPCRVEGSELMEIKKKFDQLTLELQEEACSQPVIKNPYIGQLCCACYTEDNQWYRGIIVAIEPKDLTVKVEYVDYGNMEYQPINKVHQLKPEWASLPVLGLHCQLWKIKRADSSDPKVLYPMLMQCLFQPPLLAKIKSRRPLEVELFMGDGTTLVYQPLLDDGLIIQT